MDLAKRCDGIDSGLKELTAKVAVASAPTAIIDPKLSESVATIQRGVRDLQAAQPGREIGDFVSEFKQMRLLLDRIHRVVLEIHRVVLEQAPRSSPVAVAASLPAAGFLRPPAAEPAALPSPAPGHDLVRPPAAAASASVAPPEGMLTQYNALLGLLGDQSLLPDFKTRFQAIWVTHSRDGLVADDREPEKSAANDFLFVPAGRSTASASQRTGFLLPGLNFFRARSALTHPQTLQKIFGGIFRVQETAQDRLISPARVVQSGLTLDVREEGELEFAR